MFWNKLKKNKPIKFKSICGMDQLIKKETYYMNMPVLRKIIWKKRKGDAYTTEIYISSIEKWIKREENSKTKRQTCVALRGKWL